MELTEFAIKIIFVFLPGMIAFKIIENLTSREEPKTYTVFFDSMVYGFICYLIYYAITLIPALGLECSFPKNISNGIAQLDFKEILYVSILSIIFGYISAAIINRKIIYRIARFLKVSNQIGDKDVWSFLMNSNDSTEWIVIRDIERDLVYEGWVQSFSDDRHIDDIFLRDVKVYRNSSGIELYQTPGIYIPKKNENYIIEFPSLPFSEFIN